MSEDEDDARRSRNNLVVFVAVMIVIVLGVLLTQALKKSTDLQNCVAAGHRNCEPVDTDH